MKVNKRFGIIFLSILAMLCAIIGLSTITTSSVYASATPTTFEMTKGASVRIYGTNEEDYGIKFEAKISASEYDATDKYYVMIIPSAWLTKYGLTGENPDYYDVLVNQHKFVWEDQENRTINIMSTIPVQKGDFWYACGSITNIKYNNTYREFFGIVYKTDKDGNNRCYAKLNDNLRSISQVASASLNDDEFIDSTIEEGVEYLHKSVKNAYNAKKGNAQATEDLPTISSAIENMVVSKGTKFDLEPLNIPEGLGIDVIYTTANKNAISIDENGGASVLADSGSVALTAKVLGENYTKTVTLRPEMADNMLEDFNSELSKNNIQYNAYGTCNGTGQGSHWAGTYHETYQGATGVIEIIGHDSGASQTPLRFNKTEQELIEILKKSESITYRMYAETVAIIPINQSEVVLRASDGWKDVTVTKTNLLTGTTLVDFAKSHCNTGDGKGNTFRRYVNAGAIYIDSITFNEYQPAIALDAYTLPTTAGGTFTLPTATLKKGNLVIDDANISITASVNVPKPATGGTQKSDIALTVANNQIQVHSGTTTITYSCEYQGQSYTKTITYTIGARATMASNMLEDFDDASSVYNLSNSASGSFNPSWWPASEYLDSFQGANGVVKFTAGSDGAKTVKIIFNKTEAELLAIMQTLEKVTFKIYNDTDSAKAFYGKDTATFIKALDAKVWTEVNMTKAQLLASMEGSTDEEKIANFAKMYCKTGTGTTALFRVDKSSVIYIDSVSFTSVAQ